MGTSELRVREEWQQYNGATVELAAAAADGRTAAAWGLHQAPSSVWGCGGDQAVHQCTWTGRLSPYWVFITKG